MSANDYPSLRMKIEGGRLVPATPFDQERVNSYRRGATVLVKITEEKDRVLVRKWFAILNLVLKQCKTPWKTKEEAHEAIKLALGIVNVSKTVSNQWMQYPKSLAELDDPELQEALEQMIELLSQLTGVDVETLKKEAVNVGSEIKPEDNTGDTNSQAAPDTDDDAPPATLSAEEGAGDGAAAEPAPSNDPENKLLIKYARDVLPRAADPNVQIAALNAIEKRWMQQTAAMSADGQAKAETIAKSMRAIVNRKTSLESAATYFADVLGTTEAVIMGKEEVDG